MLIFAGVNISAMEQGIIFSIEEFAIHDGRIYGQMYFSKDVKGNMLNILSRIEGAKSLKRVELLQYIYKIGVKY